MLNRFEVEAGKRLRLVMTSSKGCLISLLLLASEALWAQGSAWQEIKGQGQWGLRVDGASLVQLIDNEPFVGVTWRSTHDGKTTEFKSKVDCAYFQIVNDASSTVPALLLAPTSSTLQGPIQVTRPVKYGYYGTPEGALIDHVCSRMQPDLLVRLQESSTPCTEAQSKIPLICPGSPELNANALLLTLRSRDLVTLCHEEKKRAAALHDDIYRQALECKDLQCAQDAIAYGLQLVSRDLEGARAAELTHAEKPFTCRAVSALSDRITARLQDDAMVAYRECLQENLPKVKAERPDPTAIAKAAHGKCLGAFSKATAEFGNQGSDAEYYARQEPDLIKWVAQRLLEARKAK